jgi:UDP-glucuronate 4-epimerase
MRILVTGAAGFIGYHVSKKLSEKNLVFGIDNLNNYYDVKLKLDRLKDLKNNKKFNFLKIDIKNYKKLFKYIKNNKIDTIVHLAAQAGVRHSLQKPRTYIDSNIVGFFNILECCRHLKIKNLIFASSSSVYGLNKNFPLKENDSANHPIQLYAATKKSNEVMAHAYSYLFNIPTTCLRFFTVYGPWGRPDMALFNFTKNILNNKKINVFNYGNHARDFTYIDDVVKIIRKLVKKPSRKDKHFNYRLPNPSSSTAPFKILNLSSGKKIGIMSLLKEIEKKLKIKATVKFLKKQKGDVEETCSSIKKMSNYIKLKKRVDYRKGIKKFINWYLNYYNI